jgi:hypothetical protein
MECQVVIASIALVTAGKGKAAGVLDTSLEIDFVVATFGEVLGKMKRFCNKIEAAEKGGASMTREF